MDLLTRMIRPWAAAVPEALDSLVMEARDRWFNLGFFGAAAVVWLCSDAASLVTGIAMPVDGGSTA